MSNEISELAQLILFKISKSNRGTDYTGKIMSLEELETIFSDNTTDEILKALAKLKKLKMIKSFDETDDIFSLTPFGESFLRRPQEKYPSQPSSYSPNDLEDKILRFFYESGRSRQIRKETREGLIQDVVGKFKELSRVDVEEAVDILISQKYLDKETISTKIPTYSGWGMNGNPRLLRSSSVKTHYVKLSGKALLYLNGRGGQNDPTGIYDKSTPYAIRRKIESIFEQAKKLILIGDNYLGRKTLDYLISSNASVKILTSTNKEKNFDAALEDFKKEFKHSIEITRKDGVLHGRYIIADDRYYVLDHSIKDFGAKPSTITEVVDHSVKIAIKKLFDDNSRP